MLPTLVTSPKILRVVSNPWGSHMLRLAGGDGIDRAVQLGNGTSAGMLRTAQDKFGKVSSLDELQKCFSQCPRQRRRVYSADRLVQRARESTHPAGMVDAGQFVVPTPVGVGRCGTHCLG